MSLYKDIFPCKSFGFSLPPCEICLFLFPAVHKQVNEDCAFRVPPPKLQAESQLTLPLDINNYPMAKYVQTHFKVRLWQVAKPRACIPWCGRCVPIQPLPNDPGNPKQ